MRSGLLDAFHSNVGPLEIAFLVIVVLGPPAVMVAQAWWVTRRELVADWAASHGVVVPTEYLTTVHGHLARMAWARGWGAAMGWVTGLLLSIPGGPLGGILLGYIASTLIAELTAQRGLGRGAASLAPRRLEAYVPSMAVKLVRLLAGVTLALGLLHLVLSFRPGAAGAGWVVAGSFVLPAFGLAGEALARFVVARRQLAGSAELLAVDDALRSTAAHMLVASILAGQCLAVGLVAWMVATTLEGGSFVIWVLIPIGMIAFLGALVALHVLAPRPWQVRRAVEAQP